MRLHLERRCCTWNAAAAFGMPHLATLRLFRAILAHSYRASTIETGSTSIIIFSKRSSGTMRSSCDLSPRHENMGALYNPVPQSRAATARTRGNWSRPSPCRIAYRTRIRVRSERIGKSAYDRRQNRSGKKYSILSILEMCSAKPLFHLNG